MMARYCRKSVLALAVTTLLAANAGADNLPSDSAAPPAAQPESPARRIVLLYNGAKYYGHVTEGVNGSGVVLTLGSGEVRRFASQDVMRILPAADADRPERMIVLTNGTMLRGELVEHVPNDHLTLFLAEGVARRFEWAQLSQVLPIPPPSSPAAKRTEISYQQVQYSGEVVEYVKDDHITLRLEQGQLRRFPLQDVQQITNFEPIRPAAPPASRPVQIFANANVAPPYPEVLRETPAARKAGTINLLIDGGIFTAIGLTLLTGGIALSKSVTNADHDPLSAILGISLSVMGGAHLVVGPILLGVGGYRYTTPDE